MKNQKKKELPSFDTDGAIFMNAKRNIENCKVALFGVPYDGTTSFKPGTRFGPASIRQVSQGLETFCPQMKLDLDDISFVDLGELKINYGDPKPVINSVKICTNRILSSSLKPLMLGGEHSITIGAVDSLVKKYPDLVIIQLDAHADLRNEWMGTQYSHACTMRRCLEIIKSKRLLQIGIRSGTKQEFAEISEKNFYIPYSLEDYGLSLNKALAPLKGTPIYLTLDLDWFDPSVLPGTGTPEPGGYFWNDFISIINILTEHNVIGSDIVELSPLIDNTGISSILAAKVTRTLIMLLDK